MTNWDCIGIKKQCQCSLLVLTLFTALLLFSEFSKSEVQVFATTMFAQTYGLLRLLQAERFVTNEHENDHNLTICITN